MSQKTQILFTGATGYIGGSVLSRFLNHPNVSSFEITALVRSAEKAEKLETFGVEAVVGSHSDQTLVEELAGKSGVVIAIADADNLGAAQATLRGAKKRYETTGKPPIVIHTSGTGVLADGAAGDFTTDVIYDDLNPDQIETLSDTQPHRNVDLILLRADKGTHSGYAKVYLVIPSTIYGIASGKLVDAGIQNPVSIQVPALIRAALDRVADLYVVLYDAIVSSPVIGHGRGGIYFGENGEHTMYEVGKAIAEAIVAAGKGTNPEPSSFTKEEIDKYFNGSAYLGTNSRCRTNRSKSIGWNPKKTKEDFLDSIKFEVELLTQKAA